MLEAHRITHDMDQNGIRVFATQVSGYLALLDDLSFKCSGHSRSKLKPTSTLTELLKVYRHPETATEYVVVFLNQALGTEITADQTLDFFLV